MILIVDIKNVIRIKKEFERKDFYSFNNFPFYALREKDYTEKKFNSGLTIYFAHHCWDTPSPCGIENDQIYSYYDKGYFFIGIRK